MTPWQEGFVKQCEARGINPSAVAKYAEDYSNGQKVAQRLLAKRAAAAKAAFDSMTPYQQGFAIRCHQRGLLAEKVASFVMQKKAQSVEEIPDFTTKAQLAQAKADADAVENLRASTGYDSEAAALAAMDAVAAENAAAQGSGGSLLDNLLAGIRDSGKKLYSKGKQLAKDTVARGKAEAEELYGKGKEKAQKAYRQGRDYVKTPRGKAVVAGGGAALTAALLGAYLLSRKKKKAKK